MFLRECIHGNGTGWPSADNGDTLYRRAHWGYEYEYGAIRAEFRNILSYEDQSSEATQLYKLYSRFSCSRLGISCPVLRDLDFVELMVQSPSFMAPET